MNYTKIAGQLVCKMAMPLALMLAACSSDDNHVDARVGDSPTVPFGGAEEETGIVASLRILAYFAPANDAEYESDAVVVSLPVNVFSEGGKVVLTELDSVTLEPKGDSSLTVTFCGNAEDSPCKGAEISDDGAVRFDDVALKSPVVSLEVVSGDVSLKAIVNVRDSGSVVVDGLSHLAAYRIKKLVESDMSFASAKTQAESEIAKVFLIDPSTETLQRKAFNELVPFALLERLKKEFGGAGTGAGISEKTKESLVDAAENARIMNVLDYPSAVFDVDGEASSAYYQDCLRKKDYYADLLASVFGAGECASANEGAVVDISGEFRELQCLSKSWDLAYSKAKQYYVEHEFGSMTDARDGNTYKTVTINLDGTSQTWLAENLNYATDNSYCYMGDSSACSAYGRFYSFIDALDSSYRSYKTTEECVAVRTAECLAAYSTNDTLYCQEDAHGFCDFFFDEETYANDINNIDWEKVIDSLEVLNLDVCPEGWRMPRYEDWDALLSYLRSRFEFDVSESDEYDLSFVKPEYELLLESYGNPVGFGMKQLASVRNMSGSFLWDLKGVGEYLFLPTVLPENGRNPASRYAYSADVFGTIESYAKRSRGDGYWFMRYDFSYNEPGTGFVRCIKKD